MAAVIASNNNNSNYSSKQLVKGGRNASVSVQRRRRRHLSLRQAIGKQAAPIVKLVEPTRSQGDEDKKKRCETGKIAKWQLRDLALPRPSPLLSLAELQHQQQRFCRGTHRSSPPPQPQRSFFVCICRSVLVNFALHVGDEALPM